MTNRPPGRHRRNDKFNELFENQEDETPEQDFGSLAEDDTEEGDELDFDFDDDDEDTGADRRKWVSGGGTDTDDKKSKPKWPIFVGVGCGCALVPVILFAIAAMMGVTTLMALFGNGVTMTVESPDGKPVYYHAYYGDKDGTLTEMDTECDPEEDKCLDDLSYALAKGDNSQITRSSLGSNANVDSVFKVVAQNPEDKIQCNVAYDGRVFSTAVGYGEAECLVTSANLEIAHSGGNADDLELSNIDTTDEGPVSDRDKVTEALTGDPRSVPELNVGAAVKVSSPVPGTYYRILGGEEGREEDLTNMGFECTPGFDDSCIDDLSYTLLDGESTMFTNFVVPVDTGYVFVAQSHDPNSEISCSVESANGDVLSSNSGVGEARCLVPMELMPMLAENPGDFTEGSPAVEPMPGPGEGELPPIPMEGDILPPPPGELPPPPAPPAPGELPPPPAFPGT